MDSLSDLLVPGCRVGVVGSRYFSCPSLVESFVSDLPDVIVVSGAGGVVDLTAAAAGRAAGLSVVEFPAAWRRYGRGAGAVRNQQLVNSGLDVLVCFVNDASRPSPGSADVCRRARKAGVPVFVFSADGAQSHKCRLRQLTLF